MLIVKFLHGDLIISTIYLVFVFIFVERKKSYVVYVDFIDKSG